MWSGSQSRTERSTRPRTGAQYSAPWLGDSGVPVPPARGRVYATLPTDVDLPFGLHINADWLMNISRTGLREIEDNPWQRDIVQRVADGRRLTLEFMVAKTGRSRLGALRRFAASLAYIRWVWKRAGTSGEGLADQVRDLLPAAYAYCLEDCARDESLAERWQQAMPESVVFAEREWVRLADSSADVYFDDMEDRRFAPRADTATKWILRGGEWRMIADEPRKITRASVGSDTTGE